MPDFSTYAWNQLGTADGLVTVPTARFGHAMVWDGSRIIMFGGGTATPVASGNLAETWEFDGTDWNQLAPATSPPARKYHSMVWDGTQVIMFGGATATSGASGTTDTWVFDGSDWTDVTSGTAPPARFRHTMAWDGSRVIMYGGQTGSVVKRDTWKYEAGAWTQLTPTNHIDNIRKTLPGSGLDGRAGMPSVWDGARVVVFSGFSDSGGGGEFQTNPFFESGGGTWVYASSDWTQDGPTTNPAARWGQGFAVTDDDQKILMFGGNVSYVGGMNNAYTSETWEYDTDWTQLLVSGPGARDTFMVWDDVTARALIFGGRKSVSGVDTMIDETWEFATTVAPAETIKAINNTFGLG